MKKFVIIALVLICKTYSFSQSLSDFGINTSNQQFIEDAVDGAFFQISQSYRLEDPNTHKFYGRKGKSEFGKMSSFGVKVRGGVYVPEKIVLPWKYDENFNKYKDQYIPVRYKTQIQAPEEKEIDSLMVDRSSDEPIYFINDASLFQGDGLEIAKPREQQQGWLVWLVEKGDNSNAPNYVIYKKQIDTKKDSLIEKPNSSYNLLGAIYIIPQKVGIGCMKFELAGIVSSNVAGKWFFSTIKERENAKHTEDLIEEVSPTEDDLTLSGEDGDKKESNKKHKKKNR